MRTTAEGIALVKGFEGCRLSAYKDMEGRVTLGWGRAHGVQMGDTCTQEQADAWLLEDLQVAENLVLGCLGGVPVTDNQLSALTSFVFNVGLGEAGVKDGFYELKTGGSSTMLKCLLEQDFAEAAAQFPYWSHAGNVLVPGLLKRRLAERDLFERPDTADGAPNDSA
jgi:lysozyme